MKLESTRKDLLAPVQAVFRAVERKTTLPVLACILIKADKESIHFTATDLNITLIANYDNATSMIEVERPGSWAIPAYRLRDILNSLPEDSKVVLEVKANEQVLGEDLNPGGKVTLRCGRSRFVMTAFSGSDYPAIKDQDAIASIVTTDQELRTALDRTAYAMAKDDVRYYLNGLLLDFTLEPLRISATDGHRLASNPMPGASLNDVETDNRQVILPTKAVDAIRKLLTDTDRQVTLEVSENRVCFDCGDVKLMTTLINGKFPDYDRVIPKNSDKVVIADRELLKSMVMRTKLMLNDKSQGIELSFEPWVLKAKSKNNASEEAEDEMEINYTGDPIIFGINAGYFLGALDAIGCNLIKLSLTDAASSILVEDAEGGQGKHVIMPMRL